MGRINVCLSRYAETAEWIELDNLLLVATGQFTTRINEQHAVARNLPTAHAAVEPPHVNHPHGIRFRILTEGLNADNIGARLDMRDPMTDPM
ncbi:hypothetical protein [Azospirillum brasilense]|jgi:hypothetical protein|uniref:hypothetical protein n=1 Tax=Azospirillum brasilense TaxID=192 RepID=UPI0012DCB0B5|nr:hypothetical protein [Azospirillum brasilense]